MKTTLTTLIAIAALALPGSALAHDGWHHHHHFRADTSLTGTGTNFSAATATASGTNWSASLTTTWTSATTKTFFGGTLVCAPGTASLTVSGTTTVVTGKTCAFTKDGKTFDSFFGRNETSGLKAALFEKPDGTVKGMVFSRTARDHH